MTLAQSLNQYADRSLVIRPRLQLAIKMLQMSSNDLDASIAEILEQNPLIAPTAEIDDHEQAANENDPDSTTLQSQAVEETDSDSESDSAKVSEPFSNLEALPLDFVTHDEDPTSPIEYAESVDAIRLISDFASTSTKSSLLLSPDSNDGAAWESLADRELSLQAHLETQLYFAVSDIQTRFYGVMLIDALDECGYLSERLENIAERIGASTEELRYVLTILRGFEPCGVFANSLKDCLEIQLRERGRLDVVAQTVLDHLDLVASGSLLKIAKLCNKDVEEIRDVIREIRKLDPKPGHSFSTAQNQIASVDAVIRLLPDGKLEIELTDRHMQRLSITPQAKALEKTARLHGDKSTTSYLRRCLGEARWLQKTIQHRQTTLLRVLAEIVRQQESFFLNGVKALRPITLRDVATPLELHESTISRAISNKHVSTPFGVFEMRYFFCSGVPSSTEDGGVAASAIQELIREAVRSENPHFPMSDHAMMTYLQQRGLTIARRTVAKYREALGVGSSVQRKKNYAAA